jgi:hypothetical protein
MPTATARGSASGANTCRTAATASRRGGGWRADCALCSGCVLSDIVPGGRQAFGLPDRLLGFIVGADIPESARGGAATVDARKHARPVADPAASGGATVSVVCAKCVHVGMMH